LVILLRISALGLPKGCAVIASQPYKSRRDAVQRDFHSLAAFRPFGEREFGGFSHAPTVIPGAQGANRNLEIPGSLRFALAPE
jgi:hypothetical protein